MGQQKQRNRRWVLASRPHGAPVPENFRCLLYTSDAADDRSSVDLGGRRIIKKSQTLFGLFSIIKLWIRSLLLFHL